MRRIYVYLQSIAGSRSLSGPERSIGITATFMPNDRLGGENQSGIQVKRLHARTSRDCFPASFERRRHCCIIYIRLERDLRRTWQLRRVGDFALFKRRRHETSVPATGLKQRKEYVVPTTIFVAYTT